MCIHTYVYIFICVRVRAYVCACVHVSVYVYVYVRENSSRLLTAVLDPRYIDVTCMIHKPFTGHTEQNVFLSTITV